MKNLIRALTAAAVLGSAAMAAPLASAAPAPTTSELRAIQQKIYQADKAVVFAAIMDMLPDLGFSISSADVTTGFIAAKSATANKTGFWDALSGSVDMGDTHASLFLEAMPGGATQVRLNLVDATTSSSNRGQDSHVDSQVTSAAPYQRLFARIDAAVLGRAPGAVAAGSAPAPIGALGAGASVASRALAADLLAAARRELEAEGFKVIQYDAAAGSLVTAPLGLRLTPADADCGRSLGGPYLADQRAATDAQYFVDVSAGSVRARLAVDGVYHTGADSPDKPLTCTSRGVREIALLAKITQP
ncbi:MAG TPA: hypothetical protein VGG29_20275 [Caulobacteraceae bacterium]